MPHKHAELIKKWADGAEIESYNIYTEKWFLTDTPAWSLTADYRIKPTEAPPVVHDVLLVLSECAGPFMYAAAPTEANCRLVFDGNTKELIKAEPKSPSEPLKQPSEAFDSMFQGDGSLANLNSLGVR
jgi:hypothetical protein